MHLAQTIHSIKGFFIQLFPDETAREKKTKKYTRQMIKKYGKTLRRLSRE